MKNDKFWYNFNLLNWKLKQKRQKSPHNPDLFKTKVMKLLYSFKILNQEYVIPWNCFN